MAAGTFVGCVCCVGASVGISVSVPVGISVGACVGFCVGIFVGASVFSVSADAAVKGTKPAPRTVIRTEPTPQDGL